MPFLPHLFASLPSSPPREERKSLAEEEEAMVWAEDDTDRGDSGSIYIPASDRSRLSTM